MNDQFFVWIHTINTWCFCIREWGNKEIISLYEYKYIILSLLNLLQCIFWLTKKDYHVTNNEYHFKLGANFVKGFIFCSLFCFMTVCIELSNVQISVWIWKFKEILFKGYEGFYSDKRTCLKKSQKIAPTMRKHNIWKSKEFVFKVYESFYSDKRICLRKAPKLSPMRKHI